MVAIQGGCQPITSGDGSHYCSNAHERDTTANGNTVNESSWKVRRASIKRVVCLCLHITPINKSHSSVDSPPPPIPPWYYTNNRTVH